jgi:hypothetical protein
MAKRAADSCAVQRGAQVDATATQGIKVKQFRRRSNRDCELAPPAGIYKENQLRKKNSTERTGKPGDSGELGSFGQIGLFNTKYMYHTLPRVCDRA